MDDYSVLPVSELSSSARAILSMRLNPPTEIPNAEGIPTFWRGVADIRGFPNLHQENFQIKDDPTAAMLREWNNYGLHVRGTSVQTLLDILERLDRRDVLDDLKPALKLSMDNYNHYRRWQDSLSEQTTQVATISSSSNTPNVSDNVVDEGRYLSIHDTAEQKVHFDVFVSCTQRGKDLEFAHFLIDKLEKEYGISCFLTCRDGLGAGSKHTIHAKLIKERCRKFLVLISHDFLKSQECEFQVRFAQYLSPGAHSKKIIPITLDEGAQKPDILSPIMGLDWTRMDLRPFFWTRLTKTIKSDVPTFGRDQPEMDQLALVVTGDEAWVKYSSQEY